MLDDEATADADHALYEEGARLHDAAKYDAARVRYEQALTMLEGTTTRATSTSTREAQIAQCLGGLDGVLMKLGDDAGAGEALEQALAIQERFLDLSRHFHLSRKYLQTSGWAL